MSTANNKAKSQEELLAARKALESAEKAEFRQALMSLYIPLSLFVACCIFAAGVFMVYYEEPAGWGFIGTTVVLAFSAFLALFRFQNKLRARGIIPTKDTIVESNVIDASPEASPAVRYGTDPETLPKSKARPNEDIKQMLAPDPGTVSDVEKDGSQGLPDTTSDALPQNPTRSDKPVATTR